MIKNMFKNIGARLSSFIKKNKKIKNNISQKIIIFFSKNIFSINNIFKKIIFSKSNCSKNKFSKIYFQKL